MEEALRRLVATHGRRKALTDLAGLGWEGDLGPCALTKWTAGDRRRYIRLGCPFSHAPSEKLTKLRRRLDPADLIGAVAENERALWGPLEGVGYGGAPPKGRQGEFPLTELMLRYRT